MKPQAFGTHDLEREGMKLAVQRHLLGTDSLSTADLDDRMGLNRQTIRTLCRELEADGEIVIERPHLAENRYSLSNTHGPITRDETTARGLIERASRSSTRAPTVATDGGHTTDAEGVQ